MPPRPDRVPRRAERLSRAEARPSRLCHGQRQDHDVRAPAASCSSSEEVQAAYLEGGRRRGRREGALAVTWLSDDGLWVFLVLTVILGGGAAFLAGRGLARVLEAVLARLSSTWRCSPSRCASSTTPCSTAPACRSTIISSPMRSCWRLAALGYRAMRTTQMVTQYRWLYERTSPLTWRDRRDAKCLRLCRKCRRVAPVVAEGGDDASVLPG